MSERAYKRVSAAVCVSEARSAEQVNDLAVRANVQASGSVLTSGFLIILDHGALVTLLLDNSGPQCAGDIAVFLVTRR